LCAGIGVIIESTLADLFSKESFEQAAAATAAESVSITSTDPVTVAQTVAPVTSTAASASVMTADDAIPGSKRAITATMDSSTAPQSPNKRQRVEQSDGKSYAKRIHSKSHNSTSDIAAEDGGPEPEAKEDDEVGVVIPFDEFDPENLTFDSKVSGAEGGVVFLRALYNGKPFVVTEGLWTPPFDMLDAPKAKIIRDNTKPGPSHFKWPVSVYGDTAEKKKAIDARIQKLKPTFPNKFKMSAFDKTSKTNKEFGYEGFVRMAAYKNKDYDKMLKDGNGDKIPANAEIYEQTVLTVACDRDDDLKVCKILEKTFKNDDGVEITQNNFTNSKGEPLDAREFQPKRKYDVMWGLSVSSQPARGMWGSKARAVAIRKTDPPKQFKPKFK
jgi:hypothetical protein